MLSRIAESLFWIGRYVERAEDTARILDVQTQLILEDPGVDEETTCRSLLSIMGVDFDEDDPIDTAEVMRVLAYDTTSTASIAATMAAARESARRARETLSTSMWEAMNTTYRAIPSGHFRSMRPPVAFRWVRDRAAQINGIAEATMTRDEGYQFLVLGRSIERADMTSRLVATAAITSGSPGAPRCVPAVPTRRSCAPTRASRPSVAPPSSCCSTGSSRDRSSSASARPSAAWSGCSPPAPGPASRTRPSACSAGPAPSWSTARSATSSPSCPARWSDCNAPARWRPTRSARRYFAGAEATEWHGVRACSMQLRIAHTTGFEYDGKANTSFNEARLTPLTLPGQIVVHSRVEVSPTPWAYTYTRLLGFPGDGVRGARPAPLADGHRLGDGAHRPVPAPGPVMSWEDMRSDEIADLHTEFLTLPERVAPTEDLVARAREIADASATPSEAAREVCALVYREVKYVSGSTTVDAFAAHSWAERAGVCQDMAHIAIGALRSIGIPTRYVSGYLHPKGPRGRRARQGRVARVGRVVGRRLARLRPDQRHRARRPARDRGDWAATTTTSSRCRGSSPARAPRACSSTCRSPASSSVRPTGPDGCTTDQMSGRVGPSGRRTVVSAVIDGRQTTVATNDTASRHGPRRPPARRPPRSLSRHEDTGQEDAGCTKTAAKKTPARRPPGSQPRRPPAKKATRRRRPPRRRREEGAAKKTAAKKAPAKKAAKKTQRRRRPPAPPSPPRSCPTRPSSRSPGRPPTASPAR